MYNFISQKLEFKHLIDELTIDRWSTWNFANMKDQIKTCNPTVGFSKFTSNKKILDKFREFHTNLVWEKL